MGTIVPRVSKALQGSIEPQFKEAMRKERENLKQIRFEGAEGPHAMADQFKGMVVQAMTHALSVIDISSIARNKWNEQKAEHKEALKAQAKRASTVGTAQS